MAHADSVLVDTPYAYWRFEEESGAYGAAYGANVATIVGTPTRVTPGAVSSTRAVGFPTTSDYVQLGAVGSFPTSRSAFSYECWFKVGTITGTAAQQQVHQILGNNCQVDSFSNNGWDLMMERSLANPGRVVASVASGSARTFTYSTTRLDDNTWHHAVVTYDAITIRLYIDGVEHSNVARTGNVNLGQYAPVIGYHYAYSSQPATYPANAFPGLVDEVALYNSVLSPTRVLAHYNGSDAPSTAAAYTDAFEVAVASAGLVIGQLDAFEVVVTSDIPTLSEVDALEVLVISPGIPDSQANALEVVVVSSYIAGSASPSSNDCWVWNGTAEVPANVTVWNGTTEVSAAIQFA